MPRKPKPQEVPLKFKLVTLGNLIESDMDACGPKSDMTADERDMMAQMIKDLTLWSHVIKEEMSLSDEDRTGMLTDIELLNRWKAELLRQKKS